MYYDEKFDKDGWLWTRNTPDGEWVKASAKKTYRMRVSQKEHEKRALERGETAVWSILRDWIKGQLTAVEVGMLSFEGAFLGQIMLPSGETVLQRIEETKMLSLPTQH